MKKLSELYDIESDVIIKDIKMNSMEIEPGDLFICTMGVAADRHDYIDDAINKGASAIVVSKDGIKKDVPVIKVDNTNEELPLLCSRFYDNPEKSLELIGVTGTDGKTSVTTIIQYLLGDDTCGYIGTNGLHCKAFTGDTNNTTPDSDKLFNYFYNFKEAGCSKVAMEVSSEAYFRKRLETINYDISVITNVTSEHLNIHKTFENYLDCKCGLFRHTKENGISILNKDDKYYEDVLKACNAKNVYTYGKDKDNTIQIVSFKSLPDHTEIVYNYEGNIIEINSPLLGDFNVYNLAAAMLVALISGIDIETIKERLKDVKISGRLEMLDTKDNYYVMVDYAHTPNGIEQLLKFVHTLDINRSIVVQGVAGERDYLKRPIMGKVLVENASHVIFTYEDPRSEDPRDIIEMMIKDIKDTHTNYEIVIDRHDAIKKGVDIAGEKDIVLILGKGNENYQNLKDKTIYFNDIEEAKEAIEERLKRK